jgi:hypothetical protein
MKRREFSKPIKAAILRRASDEKGRVHCEGCGADVTGKAFEFDHTIAEALIVDKSKPLTADDGQLLGACCHRGEGGKTSQDVTRIAKAKRQEGMRLPKMRGKGFPPAKRLGAASRPLTKQLPPRRFS